MARLISIALLAVTLISCGPPNLGGTTSTAAQAGDAVTVDFIADGDTFTSTDGSTFRLDGINAPENGECFYTQSLDGLTGILEGAVVRVTPTGTDQFDRTLAQVSADGEWVNLAMVTGGMALATTPSEEEGDDLVIAEERAFADRTGLWSEDACGASGPLPAVVFDPAAGQVNPPGPDEEALAAETVVVVNRGSEDVDLSGWTIRDESSRHRFTFRNGTVIRPGESLTVASTDSGWDPGSSPVWNNGGDLALLQDPSGRIVDRYRY